MKNVYVEMTNNMQQETADSPEPLVVDLVCCLLEVLHVVSQHQVPKRQEVAVILKISHNLNEVTNNLTRAGI